MNRFLKEVKKELVYNGKKEREYLQGLKEEILDQFGSDISYEKLIENYGTPTEVAESFVDSFGSQALKQKSKLRKILISVIILSVFILVFTFIKDYFDGKNSYIDRVTEVIEEE